MKNCDKVPFFFPNKYSKGKDKVIPVPALTGPEGSMRLRLLVVLIVGT